MKTLTKRILYSVFAVILAVSMLAFAVSSIKKTEAFADEAALEAEFTNNGQFAITTSRWGNTHSFIDGTEVGGTGAVLQANYFGTVAGFKLDLSPMSIYSAAIESIVVRVKAANFTLGSDEFRTIDDTSSNWAQYEKNDDLSNWFDYTLKAQSINQFTTNGDGTIGHVNIAIRSNNSSLVMYVDSITVNISSRFNDFTNNGQFNLSMYNNAVPYQLVDGAAEEGLPSGYDGAVLKITTNGGVAYVDVDFSASKIPVKDLESVVVRIYSPGYTSADEFRTNHLDEQAKQRQYGVGAKDMSTWCDITLTAESIGDMTDASGNLTFLSVGVRVKSGATVYYIDSITVNMAEPHTADANFVAIPAMWNNLVSGGISGNILQYSVNPLGDAADATNLAKTPNRTSLRVKYNGKTFYELYADTANANRTKYNISYAHANNYFYFAIPEEDLIEGAVFEVEDGTPFMNHYLGAVTLYYFRGYWVKEAPGTADTVFLGILSDGWNNMLANDQISRCTILTYNVDLFDDVTDGTNLAASINRTSLMVKYNSKSFYELYSDTTNANRTKYAINYAHGHNYFFFQIPDADLVDGATLVIEDGTPFMNYYLDGVTLIYDASNKKWQIPTNYNPKFLNIDATYNNNDDSYFIIHFNTNGWEQSGEATNYSGITFNGSDIIELSSKIKFYGENGVWFSYVKQADNPKLAAGYNGYSNPVIEFAEGATVEFGGNTYIFQAMKFYLDFTDNKWHKFDNNIVTVAIDNPEYGSLTYTHIVNVENGADITVDGNTITIGDKVITATVTEKNPQYTYAFAGIEGDPKTVVGNDTLTANFTRTVNKYTVKIVPNADYGTVNITEVKVDYGTPITVNENVITIGETIITATAINNEQYTSEFIEFIDALTTVEDDCTITANFEGEVNKYTVTFEMGDGEAMDPIDVDYGTPASALDDLDVIAPAHYHLVGWQLKKGETEYVDLKGTETVTEDITVKAVYAIDTFTVTIVSGKTEYGTVDVTEVKDVEYGTAITVDGNKITIGDNVITATANEKTDKYTYAFTEFTGATQAVEGDLTITANFTATEIESETPAESDSGCGSEVSVSVIGLFAAVVALAVIVCKKILVKAGKENK